MKKLFFAKLFFTLAAATCCRTILAINTPVEPVHAQISTPELTCSQGYSCGQYVVQVTTQRGYGRWQIYQVDTQEHLIDTTQLPQVTGGNPDANIQFVEPGGAETATITASEP